jgi:hypothetical protein
VTFFRLYLETDTLPDAPDEDIIKHYIQTNWNILNSNCYYFLTGLQKEVPGIVIVDTTQQFSINEIYHVSERI